MGKEARISENFAQPKFSTIIQTELHKELTSDWFKFTINFLTN